MDTQALSGRSSTVHWTTLATSFGFALVQLDVTIVNVALPRIGADRGAHPPGRWRGVPAAGLADAAQPRRRARCEAACAGGRLVDGGRQHHAQAGFAALIVPFVLMPAGMGTGVPAMTTAVLAGVDKALSGVASATLNAARQAGGAMGVALFGALAGEGHVVAGLRESALIAAALLVAVALAAAILVPRRA